LTASHPISLSGSTIYTTNPATRGFSTNNGVFLGQDAGKDAVNAANSVFIGEAAGFGATGSSNSIFFGYYAGARAGQAYGSNFIGGFAGQDAVSASNSTFVGGLAGNQAKFASHSFIAGYQAGLGAASASFNTLVGYRAGLNSAPGTGVGRNNIIIGTNITLPDDARDSINLGGIIFATGSYFDSGTGAPLDGPVNNAKVGINQSNPQYALDVSGTLGVSQVAHFANLNPLPAGNVGDLAVSESMLYFYAFSGSFVGWKKVQLIL
jgi:hypothetical protein